MGGVNGDEVVDGGMAFVEERPPDWDPAARWEHIYDELNGIISDATSLAGRLNF
jgi:hypothetical protein